jgi:hypothetical protein
MLNNLDESTGAISDEPDQLIDTPDLVNNSDGRQTEIANEVGPGALAQPLDVVQAAEASKLFPAAETQSVDPAQERLAGALDNLQASMADLEGTINARGSFLASGQGDYYGDLETGEVAIGMFVPGHRRLGPFTSRNAALEALADAKARYQDPTIYDQRHKD